MKKSLLLPLLFLLPFSKAHSQDTLVLKITNLQTIYERCPHHWTPCGTIIYGKLASDINSKKEYIIHVASVETLNRLTKNSSSMYQVVLRKRYSREPFEFSGEEQYSLMDIKSAF